MHSRMSQTCFKPPLIYAAHSSLYCVSCRNIISRDRQLPVHVNISCSALEVHLSGLYSPRSRYLSQANRLLQVPPQLIDRTNPRWSLRCRNMSQVSVFYKQAYDCTLLTSLFRMLSCPKKQPLLSLTTKRSNNNPMATGRSCT